MFREEQQLESSSNDSQALAADGGRPVRSRPFAPWPHFESEHIEAASRVLKSGRVNYWTGEEGRLFEQEFAAAVGTKHSVAVANGTLALELALHALGIGPGDDVIVPCRTFIATASCVIARGARPVVADVDPRSQNLTAEAIRNALTRRTKAVIAVHLAGWPCDMDPILELARDHGLKVVEDCAQAHGATYKGRPVGSLGDAAAFSFCQDKILTTGGEGGMLTTGSDEVWERAWSYKDHGKSWQALQREERHAVFRWLHDSFGTNWRLTEMQSALGRAVLKQLPEWVERRRLNAAALNAGLADLPGIQVVIPSAEFGHSYYKYYAFIETERLRSGWNRDRCVRALQAEGIPCGSGICPEIYREKAFAVPGLRPTERLPVASQLAESSLMLLVHPTLSPRDMEDACQALRKVMRAATEMEQSPLRRAA